MTLLWLAVLGTMMAFFRVNRLAGWLFVPYLAFVSFAASLNVALWWLNH
jgi:benzodiazapine receptor